MAEASGLAGKVRRASESEVFDLAGYDQARCNQLVKDAFVEPLQLGEMVRLSFTVGGGKLTRQKYDDDLPKMMFAALTDIGYNDDKGAALELASAGCYKFQHDTNQNLKFVHVYPRVTGPQGGGEGGEEGEAEEAEKGPADVLAEAEMPEFTRMVTAHVIGYGPKQRLLTEMKDRLTTLGVAEQKLIGRYQLDAREQELYDTLTADGLKEKIGSLGKDLQALIDEGQLTGAEKTAVLEQFDAKMSDLDKEIAKAKAEGKAKLQQKMEEGKEKLQQTRKQVSGVQPMGLRPLKHGTQIGQLSLKLKGLARIEKESAGKYTMDELKRLGERPEIEEAVQVLQERSRVWFETDAEFQLRLKECLRTATPAKPKAKAASAGGGGYGGGAAAGSGWSTVKKR
mmetsp:Transcript_3297/g.6672  ORF Transcript_3297/g.6672 Transcript_3297/m.6672 type:complete len:397 (+) Transcript_3297:79-1269(+)